MITKYGIGASRAVRRGGGVLAGALVLAASCTAAAALPPAAGAPAASGTAVMRTVPDADGGTLPALNAPVGPVPIPAGLSGGPVTPPGSPAVAAAVRAVAAVSVPVGRGMADGIPVTVLDAYRHAVELMAAQQPGCHLPVALLAGIGKVESGQAEGGRVDAGGTSIRPILGPVLNGGPGTAALVDTDGGALDGDAAWDRAVGPMQFIPSTWRRWASDGNGDGVDNPENIYDAGLAAGRYLCAGGRDLATQAGLSAAILSYNHSPVYLALVRSWMAVYGATVIPVPDGKGTPPPVNPRPGTAAMAAAPVHSPAPAAPAVTPPPSTPATTPAVTPLVATTTPLTTTPTTSTPTTLTTTAPTTTTPPNKRVPTTPPTTPPATLPTTPVVAPVWCAVELPDGAVPGLTGRRSASWSGLQPLLQAALRQQRQVTGCLPSCPDKGSASFYRSPQGVLWTVCVRRADGDGG